MMVESPCFSCGEYVNIAQSLLKSMGFLFVYVLVYLAEDVVKFPDS